MSAPQNDLSTGGPAEGSTSLSDHDIVMDTTCPNNNTIRDIENITQSPARSTASFKRRAGDIDHPFDEFRRKNQDVMSSGVKNRYRSGSLAPPSSQDEETGGKRQRSKSLVSPPKSLGDTEGSFYYIGTDTESIPSSITAFGRPLSRSFKTLKQKQQIKGSAEQLRKAASVSIPTEESIDFDLAEDQQLTEPKIETVSTPTKQEMPGGSLPANSRITIQETNTNENNPRAHLFQSIGKNVSHEVKQEVKEEIESEDEDAKLFQENYELNQKLRSAMKELDDANKQINGFAREKKVLINRSKEWTNDAVREAEKREARLISEIRAAEDREAELVQQRLDAEQVSLDVIDRERQLEEERTRLEREIQKLKNPSSSSTTDSSVARLNITNRNQQIEINRLTTELNSYRNSQRRHNTTLSIPAMTHKPTIEYRKHDEPITGVEDIVAEYDTLYAGQTSKSFRTIAEKEKAVLSRIQKIDNADFSNISKVNANSKFVAERLQQILTTKNNWFETVKKAVGAVPAQLVKQFFDRAIIASRKFWSIDDVDKRKYRPVNQLCQAVGEWEPVFEDRFSSAIFEDGMTPAMQKKWQEVVLDAHGEVRYRGYDGAVGRLHFIFTNFIYSGEEDQRRELTRAVTSPHFAKCTFETGINEWIGQIERIGQVLDYLRCDLNDLASGFRMIASQQRDAGFLQDAKALIKSIGQISGPAYYTSHKNYGPQNDKSNVEDLIDQWREVIDIAIENECAEFPFKVPDCIHHSRAGLPAGARLTQVEINDSTTSNTNPVTSASAQLCAPCEVNKNPSRYEPYHPLQFHAHYNTLVKEKGTHRIANIFQWDKAMCQEFTNIAVPCKKGALCDGCHVVLTANSPTIKEHIFCSGCGMLGHSVKECKNLLSEEHRPKKKDRKKDKKENHPPSGPDK